MKILIIDCETDSSNPVVEWLKPHECYLMTTGASLKNVSYHDKNNYVGIISLDTENNDDLIYYNAEKLHQVVQFDRVIGVREFDLLPAAYLREQWGLPGPSVAAIRAYRDKGVMKTLLREANIDVPAFALIDNALDIINFVKRNGYPVLVKPRCSRRALGISVLENDEALYQRLKSGLKSAPEDVINVMVETFIEGDMYHVDGLVLDGDIKFISPSRYLTPCMGFQQGKTIASSMLSEDEAVAAPLKRYVEQVIAALPSPENFVFHAEVFENRHGDLQLCEIAARAGGGPVIPAIETVYGVNLKEIAFRSLLGQPQVLTRLPRQSGRLSGWLIVPNRHPHARVENLPTHCPFPDVVSYKVFYSNGTTFTDSYQVLAEIIVNGESTRHIAATLSSVMAWFDETVQWHREGGEAPPF
ncbi:Putative amino acid ligase of ATP-grasp superfamily [Sodalis praecaptivus]|uniref:Putative amino acid ligase of ATP-grasp superfamily n=1 Tax=Sodalis praecaptivus TaxID=1239307 RepID=W0HMW0_9GAMM|nr:ATP-grasp domain-containing protein [Sodalis praecaptivus]AHF75159.1 Putative amino acid ligase of ATP-grasp superfamily [Sodalis praecaptivus]